MDNQIPKAYCTYQAAPKHEFLGHPESPGRMKWMKEWQAMAPYPEIQWLDFGSAEEFDVALVHRPSFLADLKGKSELGPHKFEPAPTYVNTQSYQAALSAVGATLAVSRRIIAGGKGSGFAIVRPPGHHAMSDHAMGFCLLNNIAVAAADAVAGGLKKVAIFDFDAHHGNGTEDIFWETPEVAYCSIHESGTYPGTGSVESAPQARGRIVNIPVPSFSGNKVFQRVMKTLVEPWLATNEPDMLLVSAGFDLHFSDPLTTLGVDTRGIHALTKELMVLSERYCQNRLMFVLEGGYDPVALRYNIQSVLAALCGHDEFPDHFGQGPDVFIDVDPIIDTIRKLHNF